MTQKHVANLPAVREWRSGKPVVRGRLISRHPRLTHVAFLEIVCPLCRKLHWHSWDPDDGFAVLGHRYAHCVSRRINEAQKSDGYFVGLDPKSTHDIAS